MNIEQIINLITDDSIEETANVSKEHFEKGMSGQQMVMNMIAFD